MIRTRQDRMFACINGCLLLGISFLMVAPMIHLLAVSLSAPQFANAKLVGLWPRGIQFDVYKSILDSDSLWRAMSISVYITVLGTFLALLLNGSLAYALSRSVMPGRKLALQLILVTFIFPAPLIPTYLLIKELGMVNSLWSLMIPGAMGAFYVFIMKTFFQGIPGELFDAAKIDGSGEIRLFARIVLPLSMPVMATIALFHAVGQWNSYFSALIFLRTKSLYPLQVMLQNLIVQDGANSGVDNNFQLSMQFTPEMMKAGVVLFATAPILIVYPFLQKYFVQGALLGSLKE
ncbi:carbohydrate ABC transporter permease [Paenibacillus aurantius]|uniref:Carbohydrate ABC transporter permease n=1 Tax=Paenibacillus aurantius TaxID=2918900 RepID=A0AA96LB62_9BACL|nr:carbohydrate ABC transporter permease [Paenibacillus aurantius]WNQ10461.1 carbohydrate ABC transporter permease [Paenibacillus aurantius]